MQFVIYLDHSRNLNLLLFSSLFRVLFTQSERVLYASVFSFIEKLWEPRDFQYAAISLSEYPSDRSLVRAFRLSPDSIHTGRSRKQYARVTVRSGRRYIARVVSSGISNELYVSISFVLQSACLSCWARCIRFSVSVSSQIADDPFAW